MDVTSVKGLFQFLATNQTSFLEKREMRERNDVGRFKRLDKL